MSVRANGAGEYVSTQLFISAFLAPDDQQNSALVDYELGGVGISDTTEGLRYQVWTAQYLAGNFVLSAPNTPLTPIIAVPNVTELSLAFDQNMRPFFAYVQAGVAKFYWWDTNIENYTHTTLPPGSVTPRCCLDDKRESQTNSSDIILCYVLAGDLIMLRQRDRFSDPLVVASPLIDPYGNPGILDRIGMNAANRLQWQCRLIGY